MSDLLVSSVSQKGQVTIPKEVRTALGIKPHVLVGFRIERGKVELVPVEVRERGPYSEEEWSRIEKLAGRKGTRFPSAAEAKRHIRGL